MVFGVRRNNASARRTQRFRRGRKGWDTIDCSKTPSRPSHILCIPLQRGVFFESRSHPAGEGAFSTKILRFSNWTRFKKAYALFSAISSNRHLQSRHAGIIERGSRAREASVLLGQRRDALADAVRLAWGSSKPWGWLAGNRNHRKLNRVAIGNEGQLHRERLSIVRVEHQRGVDPRDRELADITLRECKLASRSYTLSYTARCYCVIA